MDDVLDQARRILEARKAEIDEESARLTSALEALAAAGGKPPIRSSRSKTPSQRVRPGERQTQFVEFLRKNPDASVGSVAQGLGISAAQASSIAARLSRSDRIVKHGRKLRAS